MFSGHPILAEIRQGTRLRPTKTVDKSKPVIVADGETLNTLLDESKIPNKPLNCENSLSNKVDGIPPPPPPIPTSNIPPPPVPPIGGVSKPKTVNQPVNTKFHNLGGKVTIDQDEFIKSIQHGFKLKPTVTNDKSGLIFDEEQLEIINAAKNQDDSNNGKRKVLVEFKKPEETLSTQQQPPPPPPPLMNVPMPPPPPPGLRIANNDSHNVIKKQGKPITNPKLLALGGGSAINVDKDEFLNSIKSGLKLKKVEVHEKNQLFFDDEELQHLSKVRDETKASSSNLSSYTASSENLLNSSYATSTSSLHNGDSYSSTSSLLMDSTGSHEPIKKKEFKWKVRDVKEETPPAHIDAGWNEEEKKWNPEKIQDEIPKGSAKARIAMLAKLTGSNESLSSNGSGSISKYKPSQIKKDLFEKKDDTKSKNEENKIIKPVKKLDYTMFENNNNDKNYNNNSYNKNKYINNSDEKKVAKKFGEKKSNIEDSFDFDGITLNDDEANEIMKEAMKLEEKPIPKPLDRSLYEAKFGGSTNSLSDNTLNDRRDRDITPKPLDKSLLTSPFINNTSTELPTSAQPSPRASPGRFDKEELEAKFGGGQTINSTNNKDDFKQNKEVIIKIEPQKEVKKKFIKKEKPLSSTLNILPVPSDEINKPKVAVNGKIKSNEELNIPLNIDTKNTSLKTGTVSALRNQFQKSVTPSPENNTLGTLSSSVKSRSLSPLAVETDGIVSPSLSQYKTAPTSAVSCRTVNTNSESSSPISISPVSSNDSINGIKNTGNNSKEFSNGSSTFGRYNPKNNNSNASRFEELRKSFNVKKDDTQLTSKLGNNNSSPISGEHIWKQAIKDKTSSKNVNNNNNNNNNNNISNEKDGIKKNRAVPIRLTNEYKRFR
ncbi:WH2 domain and Formin, FH2 domain-containing protein [Strongyloides ratti]|uniref:WH2 domain and Formin, FH2 domain-containing protein n=1 Tax=Strongyloides ratti TaxID=34506 RepID=A0A090LPE1_STRRB|nr:WH2 domain and Formin, FH2 domain-containing protein [Strongyloides ratti]CEF71626.1 WH2 domain and Formin, FH2 domain-containing protein [Strongyloides ratti]